MKRKLRFLWITCSVLMLCSFAAVAQSIPVSGTVTDQGGSPMIGVTVLVDGTTIGSITDGTGAYSLQAPNANSVITFNFMGYTEVRETVGTRRQINAVMVENIQALSDVVVVGYGTRRAGEITGSISTVNSEEIEKLAAVDVGELLRNVSGVTVLQSNTPGAEPTIRIRGLGTMNDSRPLWVVDGVPGAPVDPNNVETLTILKDAAAAAIYGTRAANGVVLVTTKAGKKNQKARVTMNLRSGLSYNTNHYDMLNAQEYAELQWLQYRNSGTAAFDHPLYGRFEVRPDGTTTTPVLPDYLMPIGLSEADRTADMASGDPIRIGRWEYDDRLPHEDGDGTQLITKANKAGTDWVREVEQMAKFHDLSMNVSGGSENTTYAFQLGYLQADGALKYTGFNRYNVQSNISSDITKWLKIGENVTVSYNRNYGNTGNNSESSVISWAYRMQPLIPVRDEAGNYAGTGIGHEMGNAQNPVFLLDKNQYDTTDRMRVTGNINATATPIKGLSVRTLFGITHSSVYTKNIDYVERAHAERGTYDNVQITANNSLQWNWTNTIDYTRTIGKHNFTALLGTEAVDNNYRRVFARRERYSLNDPAYMELNTGEQGQQNNSNDIAAWSLFSVFGRVNYSYNNRYLLEGVIRRDGSSRFGGNNKYGTFPAFSLAWRLSEESFMESTRGWLSSLKLRGGWGITGNDRVENNYNGYTQYGFDLGTTYYDMGGDNATQGQMGYRQSRFGNMDVRWETTKTTNFGIDVTLWKNLDVTFDVWQRRTTDMLFNRAIPNVVGNADAPYINVGEMLNRGYDLDITYRGTALGGELNYSINANLAHYKNEIISLGKENEILEGGRQREKLYTRAERGTAFPEFYGFIVDGIFQSDEEAKAWTPIFTAEGAYNKAGHYKYRDINGRNKETGELTGMPDGIVDDDDKTYIGSPHPKFTGGLNINIEYKNFDLNAEFYGSYGNKMVNYVSRWIDFAQFAGGRSHKRLYESWGSPYLSDNSKATMTIAEVNDALSQEPSTAFLEDASYLRMRNLMIGYNFSSLLNMPSTSSLRVYAQVSNLFTLTKYSGLDPETMINSNNRGGAVNLGVDMGAWPTPRRILFGVSLGF
ncbi:MAG: TonB-dependent receptor [Alistipes sp.]|nr:TonB-dependent receptor [Alistipes sp.]